MADAHPLTTQQISRLRRLPKNHEVVSKDEGPPIVSGPKVQLLRVKQNGRLEGLVERVRSYLHVEG
jgi:hypothetical protein